MISLTSQDAIPLRGLPSAYSAKKASIRRPKSGIRCRSVLRVMLGLLAFPAFLGPDAMAQSYVFNNASFSTGLRPSWVMTGDFNKDGIADIATVNQCGSDPTCLTAGSVSILLGNPDGTFQTAVDYATGSGSLPRFGMMGDFNGDGITDIAVANLGANTISILLGKSDGTFQPHVDYAVGSSPLSIAAGDFNGDGKIDLAVANSGSNSISILLGNGDGAFQTHVDFATNFSPQSVATADFNGDGHLDLIVADLNISVLLGKGLVLPWSSRGTARLLWRSATSMETEKRTWLRLEASLTPLQSIWAMETEPFKRRFPMKWGVGRSLLSRSI
jgi:hypothetical protein